MSLCKDPNFSHKPVRDQLNLDDEDQNQIGNFSGQLDFNQKPLSCIFDLLRNYMDCNTEIPEEKRQAAYEAYVRVTGYEPVNLNEIFENIARESQITINLNAFYIFTPIAILLLIIIWLMVGFRWVPWHLALFGTVIIFYVMYLFSVAYRLNTSLYYRSKYQGIYDNITNSQAAQKDSVSYTIQGLLAAACAVVCQDGQNCWQCNGSPQCPPRPLN